MTGSDTSICSATGSSRRASSAESRRNGRCTGKLRMPSSAVGASRSMVWRSWVSLADSASKVVPMFTNRSA